MTSGPGPFDPCLQGLDARRATEPDVPPSPPSVDGLRYRIEQFESSLVQHADRKDVDGVTILVASLDDLIMGKQWSDRDKDRVHLRLLLAVKEELRRS